jgi:hypothetical protein
MTFIERLILSAEGNRVTPFPAHLFINIQPVVIVDNSKDDDSG